jgi:hypothetical protein
VLWYDVVDPVFARHRATTSLEESRGDKRQSCRPQAVSPGPVDRRVREEGQAGQSPVAQPDKEDDRFSAEDQLSESDSVANSEERSGRRSDGVPTVGGPEVSNSPVDERWHREERDEQ